MTYRALSKAINLSESSVKRLFADGSFTLARLERVCSALDMTVADLSRMAGSAPVVRSRTDTLSLEQERLLARNPPLLACFYLLLNGHSIAETRTRLKISARAMRELLDALAAARLVEVGAKQTLRFHARLPIAWRADGPVRKLYERQVRAEFLQGAFNGSSEALTFHSAELSVGIGACADEENRAARIRFRRSRGVGRERARAEKVERGPAARVPPVGILDVFALQKRGRCARLSEA